MKATQKSAKSTTAKKSHEAFTAEERAAIKERVKETKAAADKVDVTLKSFGGEKPLADGEAPRPITSGDVVSMFTRHRKAS